MEPWYDDLLTFFLHCYHLKDWLAHDDRYKACSVRQQCRGPKPCSDSDCQMRSWLDSIAFKPPKPCRGPNPCSKPTCPECYIKSVNALDVCGGIANRTKHLVLDRASNKRNFMAGRGYDHTNDRGWFYIVAVDEHGKYRPVRDTELPGHGDPMEIATEAMDAWRTFVIRGEQIPPDHEYHQWLKGGGIPWYEFKRGPSKETQPL